MMENLLGWIGGRVLALVGLMRVAQLNGDCTRGVMVPMRRCRRMYSGAEHRKQNQKLKDRAPHAVPVAERNRGCKRFTCHAVGLAATTSPRRGHERRKEADPPADGEYRVGTLRHDETGDGAFRQGCTARIAPPQSQRAWQRRQARTDQRSQPQPLRTPQPQSLRSSALLVLQAQAGVQRQGLHLHASVMVTSIP
jgi:hypothetical protein